MEFVTGYRPGAIGGIAALHGMYYAREHGFGVAFEAKVAAGLAEFAPRLECPRNQLWTAWEGGRVAASIAIDGEDLGGSKAHLRWFILGDAVRGQGAGGRLLAAALRFCDAERFESTQLWTFSGLGAARHLYERHGFALAEEWGGTQWGAAVTEQRFVRQRAAASPGA